MVPRLCGSHRGDHGPVQRGARRTRGRGPGADPGRALPGERRDDGTRRARAGNASSTWATRTRPRHRRSPPDRSTWRWAISTPRRRCRARRSPRSTPARSSRSTSARPASRSGSSSSTPNRDGSPSRRASRCRAAVRLVRVQDTWDAIEARTDELADAFLDLTVKTSGTDMTLAERAHEAFPFLVRVRAQRPAGADRERLAKDHRSWEELYAEYYRREHEEDAPDELLSLCSATCSRRRPMRPLELTVEGFRSYRQRHHVRLARSAARRDRRTDRLRQVLDPRRDLVRPLREDAAGGGRHEVADPPAGRPVPRGAAVPGGRAGVAGRAIAPSQGGVRTSAGAACRRQAGRRRPRGR